MKKYFYVSNSELGGSRYTSRNDSTMKRSLTDKMQVKIITYKMYEMSTNRTNYILNCT